MLHHLILIVVNILFIDIKKSIISSYCIYLNEFNVIYIYLFILMQEGQDWATSASKKEGEEKEMSVVS